jgi:hypothetical protein
MSKQCREKRCDSAPRICGGMTTKEVVKEGMDNIPRHRAADKER